MEVILPILIVALFLLPFIGFWVRKLFLCLGGKSGEKCVSARLKKLPKDQYRVLNDVTIPTPKGSSQIDHVVVSLYGIFVIETKDYSGTIYGSELGEYWTQGTRSGKYEMYNPILQNAGHVRALRRALKEFESLPILPIVAFSEAAGIKVKIEESHVVYWRQLVKFIQQFEEKRLSWDQVNIICDKIQAIQIEPGKKTDKQHIQDVQKVRREKVETIASGICPRCGGNLVLRSGKYGQFYGCSHYPECRFTHPIE